MKKNNKDSYKSKLNCLQSGGYNLPNYNSNPIPDILQNLLYSNTLMSDRSVTDPSFIANNLMSILSPIFDNITTNRTQQYNIKNSNDLTSTFQNLPYYQSGGFSFQDQEDLFKQQENIFNSESSDGLSIDQSQISEEELIFNQIESNPLTKEIANKIGLNKSSSVANKIAYQESRGHKNPYKAENPNSSAVGKYQFLWGTHSNWIKEVTGVSSKEEFKNSPEAQEKAFQYWDETTLSPTAKKLSKYAPNLDEDQIKMLIHFKGEAEAKKWLMSGKDDTSKNNISVESYLSLQDGGLNDYFKSMEQNLLNSVNNDTKTLKREALKLSPWVSMFKKVEDPDSKFNHGNGAYGNFGYRKSGHLQDAYEKSDEFKTIRESYKSYDDFWKNFVGSGYSKMSNQVDKVYEQWLRNKTDNDIMKAYRFNYDGYRGLESTEDYKPVNNNMTMGEYAKKMGILQDGGYLNSTGYTPDTPSFNNPFNVIPSNIITMKNTPFDVLGIDNLGNQKLMKANSNKDYKFKGDFVLEIPQNQQNQQNKQSYQDGGSKKQNYKTITLPSGKTIKVKV